MFEQKKKEFFDSEFILKMWGKLSKFPGGKVLFSRITGKMIPYTGEMKAVIEELSPGYAKVSLRDRHKIRNHLDSIHAMALANLGEFTTGLAVLSGLPKKSRGIVTQVTAEYLKKARGNVVAESKLQEKIDSLLEKKTFEVSALIKNPEGEVVTRVKARWLVGPA